MDRKLTEENKIKGLDISKGLEQHNGNSEKYILELQTYADDIRSLIKRIEAVDKRWLFSYKTIVHEIKGASDDVFAEGIAEMATGLERAATNGDFDYIVKYNSAFVESTKKLLDKIEELLSRIDADNPTKKVSGY